MNSLLVVGKWRHLENFLLLRYWKREAGSYQVIGSWGSNSLSKAIETPDMGFLSSFSPINSPLLQPKNSIPIRKHYTYLAWSSLREHPVFSALVSSFTRGGRKATTGNTSAVRRLTHFLTRWNREYTIQYLVIKRKTSSSLKSWFTSEKEHTDHGVPPFTFDSFFINKRYC